MQTQMRILVAGFVLVLPGAVIGRAADAAKKKDRAVKAIENVCYYEGKDADKAKHCLDLYLPAGRKNFPVLFFVHGGGWKIGDKGNFGIYRAVGSCFARHGIGVVVPNYRLTPKVQHPGHVEDVARAFAWTVKNIQKYGGRPDQVVIAGHSAGGHLVALLATDDRYLKAQGLTLKAIKGVIPVSGVFNIPNAAVFDDIFGKDVAEKKKASPIQYCRADAPPFLILSADFELPYCDTKSACAFCKALAAKKCCAESLEIKHRNHLTILLYMHQDTDPATKAMLAFIQKCTAPAKRP